jgi:hypothetical protein
MDTLPFVTLRMLKPTVGIMSSLNAPVCARGAQRVSPHGACNGDARATRARLRRTRGPARQAPSVGRRLRNTAGHKAHSPQ